MLVAVVRKKGQTAEGEEKGEDRQGRWTRMGVDEMGWKWEWQSGGREACAQGGVWREVGLDF